MRIIAYLRLWVKEIFCVEIVVIRNLCFKKIAGVCSLPPKFSSKEEISNFRKLFKINIIQNYFFVLPLLFLFSFFFVFYLFSKTFRKRLAVEWMCQCENKFKICVKKEKKTKKIKILRAKKEKLKFCVHLSLYVSFVTILRTIICSSHHLTTSIHI